MIFVLIGVAVVAGLGIAAAIAAAWLSRHWETG